MEKIYQTRKGKSGEIVTEINGNKITEYHEGDMIIVSLGDEGWEQEWKDAQIVRFIGEPNHPNLLVKFDDDSMQKVLFENVVGFVEDDNKEHNHTGELDKEAFEEMLKSMVWQRTKKEGIFVGSIALSVVLDIFSELYPEDVNKDDWEFDDEDEDDSHQQEC